ncbi:MAG: Ku protein [Pseudomonadota bacterium]
MLRALWKGAISFGLIHIPVNLFSAENAHELDLDMLDKRDFAPIGFKRYNKTTGKDVKWEDIVKGYEYEDNKYVVLTPEDLKRANPEATQTIDILAFIEAREVAPIYFEQPYYLTPGKGGDKVYALLRETLTKSGKIAIAQVIIRVKQHLAALMPMGDMIVLNLLRYEDEIKSLEDYDLPEKGSAKTAVSDKEIKMAMSLVEGMTEPWNPADYKDTYRDDLMTMIKKKVASKQIHEINDEEAPAPSGSSNVVDIMALLKQSLEAKGKKPAGSKASVENTIQVTPAKIAQTKTAKPKPATKVKTAKPASSAKTAKRA